LKYATLILAALLATSSRAQSSAEVNAGTAYNFGSPGARSLGVGGAFIGIADDATAAYTNPAGLLTISRPQFAAEGRGWSFTNVYPDSGHAFGPPSNKGIDTVPGVHERSTTSNVANLSFASFVYPRRRWSVGFYRHELARFRSGAQTSGIFFLDGRGPGLPSQTRFDPTRSNLDLSVVSHGASVAVGLTDSLFAGFTLSRQWLHLDATTLRYPVNDLYGPPSYTNAVNEQQEHGRDVRFAINGGLLWDVDSHLTLGLIYRHGSTFKVQVSSLDPKIDAVGHFSIPEVFGLGIAYHPGTDGLTILSADVNHVGYSQLTKGFIPLLGEQNLYRVDDGVEFHVGYERLLLRLEPARFQKRFPLTLRLGSWREPEHQLWYTDTTNPLAALFRRGSVQYHASAGVGVGLGAHNTFDAAYDYSRGQRVLSFSLAASY
jgi:hypothetical protein